jgi:DNA-directed RNA polymerase-3 subunit RPC5
MNKSDKHIMILQFPNRDRKQPYNLASGQKPLELRIKPRSGLVELDIPMVIDRHYDRAKGVRYGQAMRKSRVLRQGASYGLAGGFGVNGASRSTRDDLRGTFDELPDEILHENFDEANNRGYIMNKITLGGRIVKPENGKPNYCIGVFKGRE